MEAKDFENQNKNSEDFYMNENFVNFSNIFLPYEPFFYSGKSEGFDSQLYPFSQYNNMNYNSNNTINSEILSQEMQNLNLSDKNIDKNYYSKEQFDPKRMLNPQPYKKFKKYPVYQPPYIYEMKNQYNPKEFNCEIEQARFFVIKSYLEDDIHKSIKYGIWSSTKNGNKKLDKAFKDSEGKYPIYLFYSVNGSGQFVGIAKILSDFDDSKSFDKWDQKKKWAGQFFVEWIFVKDVPNKEFLQIKIESNENRPVTNSRDTQEVPLKQGIEMLKIYKNYRSKTCILDDFEYYNHKEYEVEMKRKGDYLPAFPGYMFNPTNHYM